MFLGQHKPAGDVLYVVCCEASSYNASAAPVAHI